MIALSPDPIDPVALLAEFTRTAKGVGAIVSFTGMVRADEGVRELWLVYHEVLTMSAMEQLNRELREKLSIEHSMIIHRIGSLWVGNPIVFVAAGATHRRAAFDAVDFAMDRLNTSVPWWKRETRGDGEHWIEARAQDHADAGRWDETHG
jgi:molybdopterin synthase catalytic subunit